MLTSSLAFRPYEPSRDEFDVIELFRSNLNPYFVPEEEASLREFLSKPLPYFVAGLPDGRLVAAGGYALNHQYAVLTWGMVERAYHGHGLGRAFTEFRIQECRRTYPDKPIEIHTSQHTAGFYERLGFRILAIEPDKWAPGLHNYHMLLHG